VCPSENKTFLLARFILPDDRQLSHSVTAFSVASVLSNIGAKGHTCFKYEKRQKVRNNMNKKK